MHPGQSVQDLPQDERDDWLWDAALLVDDERREAVVHLFKDQPDLGSVLIGLLQRYYVGVDTELQHADLIEEDAAGGLESLCREDSA